MLKVIMLSVVVPLSPNSCGYHGWYPQNYLKTSHNSHVVWGPYYESDKLILRQPFIFNAPLNVIVMREVLCLPITSA